MNIFAKAKFTFWTIALLIALNILSLATLWYTHTDPRPPDFKPPAGDHLINERFFQSELGLTEVQSKEFEESRARHIQATGKFREDLHKIPQKLLKELFKPEPDDQKIKIYMDSIKQLKDSLEWLNLNHFLELKNICGPEKYPRLERMFRDIMNIARPPQNQPPPPPDDSRPQHPGRK